MAIFGVVAGKRVEKLANTLTECSSLLDIKGRWETTVDLRDAVLCGGGMLLSNYKAVLVLDYGFRDNTRPQKMAEDFVALQDVFQSQAIQGTKLYLLTRNSDLFRMLQSSVNGVSGTYYDDVEILLAKRDNIPKMMVVDTLQGAHDGKGLYNKEAKSKSREERLDRESQEFIEDARSVSEEVLQYGVDKPVSDLSDKDYIDSDVNRRQVEAEKKIEAEKQRILEKQQKEMERFEARSNKQLEQAQKKKTPALANLGLSKEDKEFLEKSGKVVDVPHMEIETALPVQEVVKTEPQKVNLAKDDAQEEVGVSIKVSVNDVRVGVPSAEQLQALFKDAVRGDVYVSDDKLATDAGIISVVSANNAGGSGLVANMADMYAGVGRKVLVVDLDLVKRTQTRYFKHYERAVREHKGVSNSLLKVAQGGEIKNASVSVTSRVDVLSVSRNDTVEEVWATTIGAELSTMLEEAKELYDIILIDLPFRHFHYYARNMGIVDANIFVLENTLLAIEDFFALSLTKYVKKDKLVMGEFVSRSSLVLNKFVRGRRDEDGYELTGRKVKTMLETAGNPYDNMLVAGEIPYYEDWEEQFFTGVRHIWTDEIAHSVLKSVCTKIVV